MQSPTEISGYVLVLMVTVAAIAFALGFCVGHEYRGRKS